MRTTYRVRDGKVVDRDGFPMLNQYERAAEPCMPYVMSDIPEYKNMVDGKIIGSRSEHREFLKKNNLIELGNEGLEPKKKPTHRKHEIAETIKEAKDQLEAGYVNPDEGLMPAGYVEESNPDLDDIEIGDGEINNGDYVRQDVPAEK